MAIRINSNTPQQRGSDPSQFGAIRSYTSPLQDVQAADTGRGLQQAGQALSQLGQHFKRKEDEVNRVRADTAVTNYGLELNQASLNYVKALNSKDEEAKNAAKAAFDALSPEAKDFSFNNYTDKPTDSKFYNPYINRTRTAYQEQLLNHEKLATEIELVDTAEESVEEVERQLFLLKKDPAMDPKKFQDFLGFAHTTAVSLSDNFSDPRTKASFEAKISDYMARGYDYAFSQVSSEKELLAQRTQFYENLSNGGWGDYFDQEEAVDEAYNRRLGELQANDGAEQKQKAKDNLFNAQNAAGNLAATFTSYANKDTWIEYLKESEDYLSKLNFEELEGSDLRKAESTILYNSLLKPRAVVYPEGFQVPQKPIYQYSPMQRDAIEYAKTNQLPDDLSENLIATDRSKYIQGVKKLGDDIKEARRHRDGGKVYRLIMGEDASAFSVEQFMKEEFNETRRQITINQPKFNFPSNWNTDTQSAVNWLTEAFYTNGTEKMLNWSAMSIQSASDDELSDSKLAFADAMGRAIIYSGIDTNNQEQLYSFVAQQATKFAKLYNDGLTIGPEGEAMYKELVALNKQQPEEFQLKWYKEVYDNPNIRRSRATQNLYIGMLKGHIANITDERGDMGSFFISDEKAFYNYFVDAETEVFSGILGNTATSVNGRRVLLPDGLLDTREQTAGRKFPGGSGIAQAITRFAVKTTAFQNLFRMGLTEDDPDYQEPKYLQSEIATAVERGIMYEIYKTGVQYRMSPDFLDIDPNDPLNRHNTRELVFKEYKKSELSPEELYLGLVNNAEIRFDSLGYDENGKPGYKIERVEPGTNIRYAVIKPNGEDLVIPFDTVVKNAEVDLDTRFRLLGDESGEFTGLVSLMSPLYTLPGARITDRSYFDKMQALEESE